MEPVRVRAGAAAESSIDVASEQRVFNLLSQMPMPVGVFRGPSLRCVFQNAAGREALGGGSWLEKTSEEFASDLEAPETLQVLAQVYASGQTAVVPEMPLQVRRGSENEQRYFDVNVQPYLNLEGGIDGVMVVCNDVTERIRRKELALEALKRQAHLETLVRAMPAAVIILDSELRVAHVNDAGSLMAGKPPHEIIGRSAREVWPETYPAREKLFKRVLATGEPVLDQEVEVDNWRTGFFAALVSFYPIMMEGSGTVGVGVVAVDISERRKAEKERAELLQREQQARAEAEAERVRVESLLMRAPFAVIVFDGPNHIVQLANPRYQAFIGPRPFLKRPWREVMPEAAFQGILEILDRVYCSGEPAIFNEFPFRHAADIGGPVREGYYTFRVQPVRDCQGNVTGVMAVGIDATESVLARQRLEAARDELQHRERYFRTVLDHMPQIVWTAKADGSLSFMNRRWFEWSGLSHDSLPDEWLALIHPEDLARAESEFLAVGPSFVPSEATFRTRSAEGEYRWMFLRAVPVKDPASDEMTWLGTATDIHEQRCAEQERNELLDRERAAREEAEKANRLKDQFLAVVSHELRSPLAALLLWEGLLRSPKSDEALKAKALDAIRDSARAQSKLIDDLLDVSRAISGKLHIEQQPVDVVPIIEEAISADLQTATNKGVRVESMLDHSLGQILGDALRLRQIVGNLLSNAIKFTPAGGRVSLQARAVAQEVEITVSDTGRGISSEFLPELFKPFSQADKSISRSYGGLGLGLSIVHQLVQLHGGSVDAASLGLGQGATFTVRLPILRVETPKLRTPPRSPLEGKLQGLRVLVVDDEPDVREALAIILQLAGAIPERASSSPQALQLLRSREWDLVLSDLSMPDEDGFSFIRQVRALTSGEGGRVMAVALTAHAREEERKRAIEAGFHHHLPKPIEADVLVNTLVALIKNHGG